MPNCPNEPHFHTDIIVMKDEARLIQQFCKEVLVEDKGLTVLLAIEDKDPGNSLTVSFLMEKKGQTNV